MADFSYQNISKIKDIKYSGVHPFEKKELIKRVNTAIENFNTYWGKYVPDLITNKIGYMFEDFNKDDNKLEKAKSKLIDFAKERGLSVDDDDLKNALKKGKINITHKDIEEFFRGLSTFYRGKFKKFIDDIVKDKKTKLYESIDKKSGKKVYKGGKFEQLDDQLKKLDVELGVIKYNERIVGIKTCDVTNSIDKQITALLEAELKPYHRAGKKN